jgi:hypothetical protein
MAELAADHRFSLTHGGPFFRVLRRVRLVAPKGSIRWFWLVPIAWLPLAVGALVRWAAEMPLTAVILDQSVHFRLLVSLPLILAAERLLDDRVERTMFVMRTERLGDEPRVDAILRGAERLRDSFLVEVLIAVVVVARSQALLWRGIEPFGLLSGLEQPRSLSFATFWYVAVALPLLNFVMLRWLWQWLLWCSVLVRFSRLKLAMNGMHPDGAAGLKPLSLPTSAFATYAAALTCIVSAQWSTKIVQGDATIQTFIPTFVVISLVALVLACGPLMLFALHVCNARHRDLTRYHVFAHDYVQQFKRNWLAVEPAERSVLGLADIQSLNDLGGSYEKTEKTSMFPFGVRTLVTLWMAILIPVLPVVLSAMPLAEVLEHLGKLLLGGLPT